VNVTVLLFATLKDRAGTNRLPLTLPDSAATLADVRAALLIAQPALTDSLGSAVGSINQEFAFAADPIHEGDEIAFFPPVSGGAQAWTEIYRVTPDVIDLNELTRAISTPATGAVCLFSGSVRGETNADGSIIQTLSLEYEAYEPMAIAKMQQVVAEIRAQWPLVQGIAVVQRIGKLSVGDPTVLIACASGHRDQGCFEAARYGIDRLKEIVPVWKKEIGTDGSQWVEGSYQPTADDKG